jgi:hypothetical protein
MLPPALRLVLIPVVAGIWLTSLQTLHGFENQQPPQNATELLRRMRVSLERLESIQFNFETKTIHYTDGKESRRSHTGMDFHWRANNHFFTSGVSQTSAGQEWHEQRAYDGKVYQRYHEDSRLLELFTKRPYAHFGTAPHLTDPFSFLYETGMPSNILSYVDQKHWDRIADAATLGEPTAVGEHECVPLHFEKARPGGVYKVAVYAARDLEYYPLRTTTSWDGHRNEREVMSQETLSTKRGRVVIPTYTVSRSYRADVLVSLEEDRIDAKSLLVNQEISPARFTIPRSLATSIREIDNRQDRSFE